MSEEGAAGSTSRSEADEETTIARRDLEAVIRRAVELSLVERESEERLSEDEVVRVATEVGLPAHLARQALFELPALTPTPSRFDPWFGTAVVTASRSIPSADADRLRRRLEDYLSGHEYLQLLRRRGGRLVFSPADDAISLLARGLFRPSRRYQLARARRVLVDVRSLDKDASHVQIATDFEDQRKSATRGAAGGGAALGVALGGMAAAAAMVTLGPDVAPIAAAGSFLGVTAATIAATIRLTGRHFKAKMQEARMELEGLLDRAEHGEGLAPPLPPWRRRLQQRIRGE